MGMSGKIMGWVEKKYWFNWLKDLWDGIIYMWSLEHKTEQKYRENRNREKIREKIHTQIERKNGQRIEERKIPKNI